MTGEQYLQAPPVMFAIVVGNLYSFVDQFSVSIAVPRKYRYRDQCRRLDVYCSYPMLMPHRKKIIYVQPFLL